jgi:aldose 1-epimerase
MTVKPFGYFGNIPVSLYTVENEMLSVSVTDYGAAMVSIVEKSTGKDILLGFDSAEGYVGHDAHIGGFIGRTANRIRGAEFTLNGTEYKVDANQYGNNLHGGAIGFDRVMYDTRISGTSIICERMSPDGEMGYPGDLDIRVTYQLDGNTVIMKADAKALNKDTLFAMTNHNYYNLDESFTIRTHKVTINADQYADDAIDGVSVLPLKDVADTPFDFRTEKTLGQDIEADDQQLIVNRGYDHHFAIRGSGLRKFAVCRGEEIELTIESNLPGMHMYTSNFMNGYVGKKNVVYLPQRAVCFEPEYFPNGINYEGVEQPIVKKGETAVQIISMTVRRIRMEDQ